MKNCLRRNVPPGFKPFLGTNEYKNHKRFIIDEVISTNTSKVISDISKLFDLLKITDGFTLSFHHHLRNGDEVMNMVLSEVKKRGIKNITLAATGIFANNDMIAQLIIDGNITNIYANYINGKTGKVISEGYLQGNLIMQTHGGRPRSIEAGELKIDVAFIATSIADKFGNGNGLLGKNACGVLGYTIADMLYAKKKVIVTDSLVERVEYCQIEAKYIDYCLVVESIGKQSGIVSGTTKITKDPIGLKIARDAAMFIEEAGLINNGFSMQTGAGGTSLAVASFVKDIMKNNNIKASFASGGITSYFVSMLKEGLINNLYDVQCFDLDAVASAKINENHKIISASKYANPFDNPIVNNLDFVILGATEIDLDFNVNVTTSSSGLIMGGSGGHSDTAHGAKLTIIVSPTMKARTPIIKDKVTVITTPGEDVDVLVTERGIAINPRRVDLIEQFKNSKLKIVSIKKLLEMTHKYTGIPKNVEFEKRVVGVVEYRDGSIIDSIFQVRNNYEL